MRETMIGEEIDGPIVTPGVVGRRGSRAVLGRIHARRHGRPYRIRLRRADGGEIDRGAGFDETSKVRQPPLGGAGPDVFERRAVEEQEVDARRRRTGRPQADLEGGSGWHGDRPTTRGDRQGDGSDDRNGEQRRADATAAASRRIVRDGNAEQHDGARRGRERTSRHTPRGNLVQGHAEPGHVQPHQQRGASRHARRQPGEHANADPARRQHVEAEELARHHQNVEEHGEVDAVERTERGEPPQHGGRHLVEHADSAAARAPSDTRRRARQR